MLTPPRPKTAPSPVTSQKQQRTLPTRPMTQAQKPQQRAQSQPPAKTAITDLSFGVRCLQLAL